MSDDRVLDLLQQVVENTAQQPITMPIPMQRMEMPDPQPEMAGDKVRAYLDECQATGQKPLSTRKAAEHLGVSKSTVSRVYQEQGIE